MFISKEGLFIFINKKVCLALLISLFFLTGASANLQIKVDQASEAEEGLLCSYDERCELCNSEWKTFEESFDKEEPFQVELFHKTSDCKQSTVYWDYIGIRDNKGDKVFKETWDDGVKGWETGVDKGDSGGSFDYEINDSSLKVYTDGNCRSPPYDGAESWLTSEEVLSQNKDYELEYRLKVEDAGQYDYCVSDEGGIASYTEINKESSEKEFDIEALRPEESPPGEALQIGELEQGEVLEIDIPDNLAVHREAFLGPDELEETRPGIPWPGNRGLGELPLDEASIEAKPENEKWYSKELTPGLEGFPTDIWSGSDVPLDEFTVNDAVLSTQLLDTDQYRLYIWGCESDANVPEDCEWITPRSFSVTRVQEPGESSVQIDNYENPDNVVFGESFEVEANLINKGDQDTSVSLEASLQSSQGDTWSRDSTKLTLQGDGGDNSESASLELNVPIGDGIETESCGAIQIECTGCEDGSSQYIEGIALDSPGTSQICQDEVNPEVSIQDHEWSDETGTLSYEVKNHGEFPARVRVFDYISSGPRYDARELDRVRINSMWGKEIESGEVRSFEHNIDIDEEKNDIPNILKNVNLGWIMTGLNCTDSCTTREPEEVRSSSIEEEEIDSFTVFSDGYKAVAHDGQWYRGEIGEQGHQLAVRSGSSMLVQSHEDIPPGGPAEFEIFDAEGNSQDIYRPEYNFKGNRLNIGQSDAVLVDIPDTVDEGEVEMWEIRYDWGEESLEMPFEVHKCGDGEIFNGIECVPEDTVMHLVGVPFYHENHELVEMAGLLGESTWRYSSISPLHEEYQEVYADGHGSRGVITYIVSPEEADLKPEVEEASDFINEAKDIADGVKPANGNWDISHGIVHKRAQDSDMPRGEADANFPDRRGRAAYTSSGPPELVAYTFSHEMGHLHGLCHVYGDKSGGSCNMNTVAGDPSPSDFSLRLMGLMNCPNRFPSSEGPGAVMNYCKDGFEYFSGGPNAPGDGDEYEHLKEVYSEEGWIQETKEEGCKIPGTGISCPPLTLPGPIF